MCTVIPSVFPSTLLALGLRLGLPQSSLYTSLDSSTIDVVVPEMSSHAPQKVDFRT